MYVDNLRVGRCLLTDVSVESQTSTSVTIGWSTVNAGNDTTASQGEVTLEPVGSGATVTVGSNDWTESNGRRSYTLSGLEAGTSYTWLVYGSCDDGHCAAATVNATTYAQDYTLPYCTDFEESGTMPTDWVSMSGTNSLATDQYHSANHSL